MAGRKLEKRAHSEKDDIQVGMGQELNRKWVLSSQTTNRSIWLGFLGHWDSPIAALLGKGKCYRGGVWVCASVCMSVSVCERVYECVWVWVCESVECVCECVRRHPHVLLAGGPW
jgi:hypothetical protein